MIEQRPTPAPPEFIRRLEEGIRNSADISPAYLSRILHGVRGVPADSILVKLEDVLDINPRGQLFDAAGRHDAVVSRVLKKEKGRVLMRKLAPLTDEDLSAVLTMAEALSRKYRPA